jgi:predicted CXXCH cytochrome family protein
MRARWGAAITAAALAASAGAGTGGGGTCELGRVERRRATSRECMSCHDGSAGTAIGGFQMRADGRGPSHPVEVDYASVAAAHPDQYQPAASLPASVPLVRGRIECTTCHDPGSRDPKHVADTPDLCLACHKL